MLKARYKTPDFYQVHCYSEPRLLSGETDVQKSGYPKRVLEMIEGEGGESTSGEELKFNFECPEHNMFNRLYQLALTMRTFLVLCFLKPQIDQANPPHRLTLL